MEEYKAKSNIQLSCSNMMQKLGKLSRYNNTQSRACFCQPTKVSRSNYARLYSSTSSHSLPQFNLDTSYTRNKKTTIVSNVDHQQKDQNRLKPRHYHFPFCGFLRVSEECTWDRLELVLHAILSRITFTQHPGNRGHRARSNRSVPHLGRASATFFSFYLDTV